MVDYPYAGILVADAVTFRRATSAAVTVYDVNDTAEASPLALKDLSGLPLPNPLTSSADGFVQPFVTTSEGVKLKGGGLTVVEYSHKGMRDAAAAAATAAQDAANAAIDAAGEAVSAATVNPQGNLILTQANGELRNAGNVIGPAGPKGDKGADGANVLPTDTAIKNAITTPGTETAAALSATYARKFGVNLADYTDLKAAIAALPATGGTVFVPVGRHAAGSWTMTNDYMNKPGVRIVGEKAPRLSANADRLEGGSVIYGRFNVFADGFEATDVGFDMGKYTMDSLHPTKDSHTADHPLGGTWDAFAFAQPNQGAPLAARRDVRLNNVIGLLRDSQSVGHAILMEGMDGAAVDNITGVGGVHALVIKSQNVRAGRLSGYAASNNNIIFKSDTYAAAGNISASTVEALTVPPNTTPWFTPAVAGQGLLLNPSTASFTGPVQIGTLKVLGSGRGLAITGGASFIVSDVQIDAMTADGTTGTMASGIDFFTCRAMRVQINSLNINNSAQGIAWNPATAGDNAEHQIHIGSAQISNISVRAINASGYARIRIDSLEIASTNHAYYCSDDARIIVGKETIIAAANKWERNSPALSTGWTNFGSGNATFEVKLENYGVLLAGLLSAGSGVTGTITSMPVYLRPPTSKRLPGYLNAGSRQYALIGVDSGGAVTINDATAPAAGNYASIDGIGWQHW